MKAELSLGSVHLLNDLEASAWGIRVLQPHEQRMLSGKTSGSSGNRALIAAGTGLGEAGLFWDGREHRPFATEGGHADFAPRNDREIELLRFLQKKFGHVSYERILSGSGLVLLQQFLVGRSRKKRLFAPEEISKRALMESDSLCVEAVRCFLSVYGAEAGNLALKHFASGGLYISGAIARALMKDRNTTPFISSFHDKGRLSPFLKEIPVVLVLNEDLALLGAREYALRKTKTSKNQNGFGQSSHA